MIRQTTISVVSLLLSLLLISPLTGCSGDGDDELERALNKAGRNREELADVLSHYKGDKEKYAAARWLIVNMPGHYGYEGEQLDTVEALLNSLQQYTVNFNFPDSVKSKWHSFSYSSLPRVDDIRNISAEYLIENIDMAYDEWKNRPWNKDLSFDDFCEKLLVYRVGDERVTNWRKLFRDYFGPKLDSLYQGEDLVEAAEVMHSIMNSDGWIYNNELSMPHRDATGLFHARVGSNRDQCDMMLFAMRSVGIPVSLETMVVSPDNGNIFQWLSLYDPVEGRTIPFTLTECPPSRDRTVWDYKKKGKVYRVCFSEQADQRARLAMIRSLSVRLNNPFYRDVTADYFGHNTVDVPVDIEKGTVFAALYSPERWLPVDVGKATNGKAVFHDIESGVMFLPTRLAGARFTSCGNPFIVMPDGEIDVLKPDTTQMVQMSLQRVRPLGHIERKRVSDHVIGMVFEGSMESSFSFMPDTIGVITDTLRRGNFLMYPSSGLKYKYIRVSAPDGQLLVIPEIKAFADRSLKRQIGMKVVTDVPARNYKECATDGNIILCFTAPADMRSVVLSLDYAYPIEALMYYPRSNGCFIEDNVLFTLYYYDYPNGWKSLGTKRSDADGVEFEGPSNALFRLEQAGGDGYEQVFVYRDGKQMFAADFGDPRK